jgi:putative membrane protein
MAAPFSPEPAASPAADGQRADRSIELAADRTVLAAERTYAAWVRTGLGSMASGLGARALLAKVGPTWFGGFIGSVLILFSAFCFAAAVWRELRAVPPSLRPDTRRMPGSMLIVVNGILVLVDLVALVGIWAKGG